MKKRGNQTRKGRRQNTKKRRVQVRQRKSRKMVGGVNFFSRMMGRKDAKIFPEPHAATIYPEPHAFPMNIILKEDEKHNAEMQNLNIPYSKIRKSPSRKNSNLEPINKNRVGPFVPFGYEPNKDPDGSELARINEELDIKFNDEFGNIYYDPSYEGDNEYSPERLPQHSPERLSELLPERLSELLPTKVTISSRKPGELYNPAPITYFDPTSTSLTRFQNKLPESQTNVVQNEFLEPQQSNDELDNNTISTIQDNEPQVLFENIYPKLGWLSRRNIRQKIKEQNYGKSPSSKFTKKNKKP
jgi:hypothetical protein